jgi:predicted ATPase
MRFTRIQLTNWKNFRQVDVALPLRAFLIGPNASGKSNFLDVFRFLRDLAMPGGGLQRAVAERGAIASIRSDFTDSSLGIRFDLQDSSNNSWSYGLGFTHKKGTNIAQVEYEHVSKNQQLLLERPTEKDQEDRELLSQTYLEQTSQNQPFREILETFRTISYFHLMPQVMRGSVDAVERPEYGTGFLKTIHQTEPALREKYLLFIEEALKASIPGFSSLQLTPPDILQPGLIADFVNSGWDSSVSLYREFREQQLSDGTLRLIGLLWALQAGDGLLLLEEPELSLHRGILNHFAALIHKTQTHRDTPRQVFITTHNTDLLLDPGIDADEVLLFRPEHAGTHIVPAANLESVQHLMAHGLTAAEAALPATENQDMARIRLLEL